MKGLIKWLKAWLTKLEGEAAAEVEDIVADLSKLEYQLTAKVADAEEKAKEYYAQHIAHSNAADRAARIAKNIRELLA